MYITSVGYDFFKGFCTAFIEINGQPETIFGKPPVAKIIKLVNVVALVEAVIEALTLILLMLNLAGTGLPVFVVMIPIGALWASFFVSMIILYCVFVFSMFRYAKSLGWIACFVLLLPIGFVNMVLFFGAPTLVSIIFPMQQAGLWQAPKTWDSTLYLLLGLLGGFLKHFVRPTDDDENPYAGDTSNIATTVVYFMFLISIMIWLVLITAQLDRKVPFINSDFRSSYWLVFLPLFLGCAFALALFLFKTIVEWRLFIKKKDPNGDARFRAANYTCITIMLTLLLTTEILVAARLDNKSSGIPAMAPIIPIFIGELIHIVVCVLPFVITRKMPDERRHSDTDRDVEMKDKERDSDDEEDEHDRDRDAGNKGKEKKDKDKEKEEKKPREMLTFL